MNFSRLAKAILSRGPEPEQWNQRVIDPMIRDEGPGYVIHPDTLMRNLQMMRDYPMEMTEAGDLFALVPQAPQAPQASPWQTETVPADPWNTKVLRNR